MTKIVIDADEVYELKEAAALLNIGIATLFRWLRKGKIMALKIGRRTLITKGEIERLKN